MVSKYPESSVIFLKNGVSFSDLEKGTEIEIEPQNDYLSDDESDFDNELSNSFKTEFYKIKDGKIDTEIDEDIANLTIEELKPTMEHVTDDGYVLKKLLHAGTGPPIPQKSILFMHYNAYIENEDKPFDSTYFRGYPSKHLLSAGRLIYGVEKAVLTMRKGEKAKFWIHCDYAYGPHGCPPRIPENANIVYEIEIMNFYECREAIEFEEMLPEDQRTAPFSKVYAAAKVDHQLGNDLSKNKKYMGASSRYLKAVKWLENINVADEEEDKKRNDLLLKLYLNVAFCFLKQHKAKRAITFARKAVDIDANSAKALYRMGRAHLALGELEEAKMYLLRAKHIVPYDELVNGALLELEERSKVYKNICQRMFQQSTEDEKKKILSQESAEFVKTMKDKLADFKDSSDEEYTFSGNYSPTQIEVIKVIVQSMDLHFIEKIHDEQKILKAKKKEN